jgi:hypothetical protein
LEPSVVIGAFRVAAEPACRANEAETEAATTTNAKMNCTEMFDMGKLHDEIHYAPKSRMNDPGFDLSKPLN